MKNNILITQPIGSFVQRIIRDKNGQLVRATFCVYECSGHIKARLITAELIQEVLPYKKIFALAGFVQKEFRNWILNVGKVVSPYFSLNTLFFSGSKPRALTF